ncbi:alpha/beta fold hydrolase [Streptacidiphilus griseoplanus]|uniref:alpha/beta fold hydrolase n=1 Tax=Peterkaempfera griseoplana TaxID=66896 RepID=UPI0006E2CB03|nr:alpha/beta hydrolase [Peterkaempfera griseoplana]
MSVVTARAVPTAVQTGCAEERKLSFGGFGYTCRVVRQDDPVTAPVLLLGGSAQDRNSWVRHERWLTPLCTVVTVDLPGYGSADFLPARYGLDFLAAAVRHLLDELGTAEVNLVGACFGGAVGLRVAQHYPERVRRLVLAGMTRVEPRDHYGDSVPRWSRMLEAGRVDDLARELAAWFVAPPGQTPVRKQAAMARFLYRQFVAQTPAQLAMWLEHNIRLVNHEWYRPEPLSGLPVLVVTGEHDILTTPRMGREVAACLPGARFTTVREADHLVHLERMGEFTEVLARFCTDRPVDGLPWCTPLESWPDRG